MSEIRIPPSNCKYSILGRCAERFCSIILSLFITLTVGLSAGETPLPSSPRIDWNDTKDLNKLLNLLGRIHKMNDAEHRSLVPEVLELWKNEKDLRLRASYAQVLLALNDPIVVTDLIAFLSTNFDNKEEPYPDFLLLVQSLPYLEKSQRVLDCLEAVFKKSGPIYFELNERVLMAFASFGPFCTEKLLN